MRPPLLFLAALVAVPLIASADPRYDVLIRPGLRADLVVFDPEADSDRASFEAPHAYSAGIPFVLVNGELVVDRGEHTGARAGRVLLGPGT